MKVALAVFFNYPFERNIPVLEELYGDAFDEIVHIQPMVRSARENVNTVYRAAFNFGGFFSDSLEFLRKRDADFYVFAGDDCILNTSLFGKSFEKTFLSQSGRMSAFIPELLKFVNGREWTNRHRISSLARFIKGDGLYCQRIEEWQTFMPDRAPLELAAKGLGVHSPVLPRPSEDVVASFRPAQHEVFQRLMGNKEEVPMPYPLVYAISDFFVVSREQLETFCHNVGLLATMNVFSEVAVPTALLSLPGPILQAKDLALTFQWTWGRNQTVQHFVPTTMTELREFIAGMDESTLFHHPIKLSRISAN